MEVAKSDQISPWPQGACQQANKAINTPDDFRETQEKIIDGGYPLDGWSEEAPWRVLFELSPVS